MSFVINILVAVADKYVVSHWDNRAFNRPYNLREIFVRDIRNYYPDSFRPVGSQSLSIRIYGVIVFLDDCHYLFFGLCRITSVLVKNP